MTEQEAKQNLLVLVELDLYKKIQTIMEANNSSKEKKEMIQEEIISFEESLPEIYKKIPNVHTLILNKLKEIEIKRRKLQEEKNTSKLKNTLEESER